MNKIKGWAKKIEKKNPDIIRDEEKRVAKRFTLDLVSIAAIKNEKIINTFKTLQKIKKDVDESVEVFWWSYKMRLNSENVYLAVLEMLFPDSQEGKTMTIQGMARKTATNKARRQSKSLINRDENNRVYVFRHCIESNQYYTQGMYYTLAVGPNKSFNLGGKDNVSCYYDGKRVH